VELLCLRQRRSELGEVLIRERFERLARLFQIVCGLDGAGLLQGGGQTPKELLQNGYFHSSSSLSLLFLVANDSSPIDSVLIIPRFGKENPRCVLFLSGKFGKIVLMRPLRESPPPDWQMPPGVNRGLWHYLHDPDVARNYDAGLAGVSLLDVDLRFVEELCPRPGQLIDLGCGTGRLLAPLATRGYRVLGVDLSAEMLAVARGKTDGAVPLLRANIADLNGLRDQGFDYAACLFSTLGMVIGEKNRRQTVAHVFRLLRPGGRFVLHVHNRWFNVWNAAGRAWLLQDIRRQCARAENGDRVMPLHQGVAGLALHLFTRGEARRLLTDAGFHIHEIRPVSLAADGRLRWSWWFGGLRAYGYLIAADRPALKVASG
jgi:SAM-dependent methyltransferase